MKALHAAKLPVARVHWLEQDEKVLGTGFYVMGRIEGVVPPEFPPYHSFGVFFDAAPQKRARMWWSAIEAMSRVHQADWKKLGLSFLGVPGGGTGPLDRQLDYFERYLGWAKDSPDERQPVLEAALKWLRENRLPAGAGDPVLGGCPHAQHHVQPGWRRGGALRLGDGLPGRPPG